MIPHILAISTSPRRHGNSEPALDTILAETSGRVSAEKVVLADLSIAPAKAAGHAKNLAAAFRRMTFNPSRRKSLMPMC